MELFAGAKLGLGCECLTTVPIEMKLFFLLLFAAMPAMGQLSVVVSPAKVSGQKAVVPLELKNNFAVKVESARAACFVFDEQGKMVGQASRWVIGGDLAGGQQRPAGKDQNDGLAAGGTNRFNFVVTSGKPFTTTNLTARVQFSRVVLEGGRSVDVRKEVEVKEARE